MSLRRTFEVFRLDFRHHLTRPLFWILVIAGLFFLFRRRGPWGPHRYQGPQRESAAELLERRFAAGEISSDEYRERRSVLDPPERG